MGCRRVGAVGRLGVRISDGGIVRLGRRARLRDRRWRKWRNKGEAGAASAVCMTHLAHSGTKTGQHISGRKIHNMTYTIVNILQKITGGDDIREVLLEKTMSSFIFSQTPNKFMCNLRVCSRGLKPQTRHSAYQQIFPQMENNTFPQNTKTKPNMWTLDT